MSTPYKNLVSEIAKRGIKKRAIANEIGVSERTFYTKLSGESSFTWEEICKINSCFFPDMSKDDLMKKTEESEAHQDAG